MEVIFLTQAAQLGGTVFTVVAFLWYLTRLLHVQTIRDRDAIITMREQTASNISLAKSLQRLADIVGKNTQSGAENTAARVEGTKSTDMNTSTIKQNTEVLKEKNGH